MATSGSTDFNLTAADVITEARRKLGVQPSEEALQSHEESEGLTALNAMLKAWQTQGIFVTGMTEGSYALSANEYEVTFGTGQDVTAKPFEIVDVRINRGTNDVPMNRMSRQEYLDLPNKTTTGHPTQWFYDRLLSVPKLYVWPAADTTAGTLKFTYRRRVEDLDAGTNDFDCEQEWYEAIIYNLAVRLMPHYDTLDVQQRMELRADAQALFNAARDFDIAQDEGSVSILPSRYGRYRGR